MTEWLVYVGRSQGASDVFDSGSLGTSLSKAVSGFPRTEARFTFDSGTSMTSPARGSTLAGSSQTFTWNANGTAVSEWWLYVGTSPGALDVFDSGSLGAATSVTVGGIPTDGRAIHVRLWYRVGGLWQYSASDFGFTAAP